MDCIRVSQYDIRMYEDLRFFSSSFSTWLYESNSVLFVSYFPLFCQLSKFQNVQSYPAVTSLGRVTERAKNLRVIVTNFFQKRQLLRCASAISSKITLSNFLLPAIRIRKIISQQFIRFREKIEQGLKSKYCPPEISSYCYHTQTIQLELFINTEI